MGIHTLCCLHSRHRMSRNKFDEKRRIRMARGKGRGKGQGPTPMSETPTSGTPGASSVPSAWDNTASTTGGTQQVVFGQAELLALIQKLDQPWDGATEPNENALFFRRSTSVQGNDIVAYGKKYSGRKISAILLEHDLSYVTWLFQRVKPGIPEVMSPVVTWLERGFFLDEDGVLILRGSRGRVVFGKHGRSSLPPPMPASSRSAPMAPAPLTPPSARHERRLQAPATPHPYGHVYPLLQALEVIAASSQGTYFDLVTAIQQNTIQVSQPVRDLLDRLM